MRTSCVKRFRTEMDMHTFAKGAGATVKVSADGTVLV